MGLSLNTVMNSLVIAFLAAFASWLPIAVFFGWESGFGLAIYLLPLALLGSYAIGLPVALLTFFLAGPKLIGAPTTVAMISILAGVMMVLASYAIGGSGVALFYGVPSFIAACTYGVLGWFWVLKPIQAQMEGRCNV